jgi:hypothetical protein
MKDGLTHIPRNFFVEDKDIFGNTITENHKYEQFFWTENVVKQLLNACEYQYVEETCCLTTPSLAHGFHESGRDEVLLDIDERFKYLPKYKFYDVRNPHKIDDSIKLLIMDPPFFIVPIEQFRKAVDILTDSDYTTKIMIGFLKRDEKKLMEAFNDYKIKRTTFKLEYASIKQNKWSNFALYSNIDLPGIKRIVN